MTAATPASAHAAKALNIACVRISFSGQSKLLLKPASALGLEIEV